jgi:hypothetical protein
VCLGQQRCVGGPVHLPSLSAVPLSSPPPKALMLHTLLACRLPLYKPSSTPTSACPTYLQPPPPQQHSHTHAARHLHHHHHYTIHNNPSPCICNNCSNAGTSSLALLLVPVDAITTSPSPIHADHHTNNNNSKTTTTTRHLTHIFFC